MDHLLRQSDFIPMNKLNKRINIIGAGAVGSHTSIALAKMGFTNQCVWDFDEVSIENMNCQGYRFKDIGKPKVEALVEIVEEYSDKKIDVVFGKYEGQPLEGIVISAVDSMLVRKVIWEAIKGEVDVDYLIDPRMSLEYAVQYVMKPFDNKDIAAYEKTLFDDGDSVQERCTAKSVMYTANLIAGLASRAVKNIICSDNYDRTLIYNIETNDLQRFKARPEASA